MISILGVAKEPRAYLRELSGIVFREIEATLGPVQENTRLQRMLLEPIKAQADSNGELLLRRSFLTLLICQLLCGRLEHAVPAGAAIEFFAAAPDVFDDLEDLDNEEALWRRYGHAQALNAASALLMLAQLAVTRLKLRKVDEITVARVMETIALAGSTACAGQHYDLEYESNPVVSEAQYLNMIRMKSASLVECACRVGATLAGVDGKTVNSFGRFGCNLGMAAQIINDVESSVGGRRSGKSDVTRRKKTLPVVFALTYAAPRERNWLAGIYGTNDPMAPNVERQVLEVLRRSGAIYYSVVQAELYKQKAVQSLERAETSDSVRQTLRLALGI